MASAAREDKLNITCPVCGSRFHLKKSAIAKAQNHYCSKACHYAAKKQYMRGEKNHQYGLRGQQNASWQGGRKLSHYGYWLVQCIGHPFAVGRSGYVLEHRLVAEKYLLTPENSVEIGGKRYLSPDYIVHHKNKNRLDNRVENLVVMTEEQHRAIHSREPEQKRERNAKGQFISPRGSNGFGSTGR